MNKVVIALMMIFSVNAMADAGESTRDLFQATGFVISSPTYVLACAHGLCKQVLPAFNDIAAFVATDGEIRTAALEQALQIARGANITGEDMEVAQELLLVLSN